MHGYLQRSLFGAIAFLCISPVLASPGTQWLETQFETDGSFQNPGDIATAYQSTAETLRAFNVVGDPVTVDLAVAGQFLNDAQTGSTEHLSRNIIANARAGEDVSGLADQLLARQNRDGGFGDEPGYDSTTLDTAFALEALAMADRSDSPASGPAVGFLLDAQRADGSWALGDNQSSVYVTALALRSVWHYRQLFDVQDSIDQARSFLLAQRDSNALWGDVFKSALSLIATAPTLIDRSDVQASVDALRQLQQPDGSFGSDVYQTALALRALRLAELPSPDEIRVAGRVLDGETGLPLAGVTAALSGPVTLEQDTNDNGEFQFADLQPGNYELTLSLENYSPLTTRFSLQVGRQLDFGDLQMLPAAASPTTGVVIGTVTDADAGDPVAGAQVNLSGPADYSATTTADGAYQIVNITPGDYTLRVDAGGFLSVTADAAVQAGQTRVFSPALTPLADVAVTVEGIVTGQDTGQPLEGVEVTVQGGGNDATATTGADGRYQIGGLQPGELTLTATLVDYQAVAGTVTASDGARIDFSPVLTPEGQAGEPQPGGVTGMAIDRSTGEGLAGVAVTLEMATGTQSAISGTDGEFSFSDIEAGPATLGFDLAGFQPRSVSVEIADNTVINLGEIELLPADFQETAGITGRVVDARTDRPLQGVTVDLSLNSGNQGFVTGENGLFEFTGLTDQAGTVNLSLPDYESVSREATLVPGTVLNLGEVRLREEDVEVLLPDAAVQSLNAGGLMSDPHTFAVSGQMEVTVVNRGNAVIDVPLDVLAFYDADNDGLFDADVDTVLGESRMGDTIAPDDTASLSVEVAGDLPFRDAPVTVWVDSAETLAEPSEVNNVESTDVFCDNSGGGPAVDLAFCLDASGSVSFSEFQLQLEGTARALENPDIVPQNGSVRVSVTQFSSSSRVELVPTIIESDNIADIAATVRDIPKRGGGTAIHSCVDTARDQITGATPASAQQVIDVSTDGGSSLSAALAAVDRAQQAGIDTLNAIGVGGANIGLLEQIVYPQPAGGDRGFVVDVNTFEEYVTALSGKVQQEVRIADLTLGGLELVDNGTGQPVSLRAVAGNAGSGTVPAGTVVEFYAGDPDAGGVLLESVSLDALASGEFVTVQVDGLDAAQLGTGDVVAVADRENVLPECEEQNNRISAPVGATSGQIGLASDQAVYAPAADALFTMAVSNTGAVAGTFTVDLTIADSEGNTVTAFTGLPVDSLAGGASTDLEQVWDTGSTLAGNYAATAVLRTGSGAELDRASVNIAVDEAGTTPDGIVTLRTTTDRQTYHTSDTAVIEDLVQNVSTSTLISGAALQVTVTDPTGAVVFNESVPVNSLPPGGQQGLFNNFTFAGLSEGSYSVAAEVAAGSQTLATGSAQFELVEDLRRSLAGSAEAQSPTLFTGETQVCNYTVENTGTLDLQGQPLWQVVVDITNETEVEAVQASRDIASGSAVSLIRSSDTTGLSPGDYACVLEATIDGERRSLAQSVFHLEEPPIQLSVDFTLGERGRVLVLLDEDKHHCDRRKDWSGDDRHGWWGHDDDRFDKHSHNDRHERGRGKYRGDHSDRRDKHGDDDCRDKRHGHGPHHREQPDPGEQREHLEQLLDEAGWSYTIVTDKHDFSHELRSGGYTVYALLSERVKLDNTTLEELREAVFRGEGLLVAGGHDERNSKLNPALGVKFTGRQKAAGVDVSESDFHAAGSESLQHGKVRRMRPETAQTLAAFTGLHPEHGDGGYHWKGRGCDKDRHDNDRHKKDKDRDQSDRHDDKWHKAGYGGDGHHRKWRHHPHCEPVYDTAIAGNDYGEGRAVTTGFDLLREATAGHTSEADTLFDSLLLVALGHVRPESLQLSAGDVLPLHLSVENTGIATPGRAVLTLPPGTEVLDAGSAAFDEQLQQWLWSFNLADSETAELNLQVRPPYTDSGTVVFNALIQTGTTPDFVDYETVDLTVQAAAAPDLDTVLADLNAAAHADHKLKMAAWRVRKAGRHLDRDRPERALHQLLKAADWLAASTHPQADALRVRIGRLIKTVARQANAQTDSRGWFFDRFLPHG